MRTDNVVRGIIIRNGMVLLIHRFKEGKEYWVAPGGGMENEETPEEALHREMMEETSLITLSCKLIATVDYEFSGKMHVYLCEMSDGEPAIGGPEKEANNENNQYILTWMPIDQAKKLEHFYPKKFLDFI